MNKYEFDLIIDDPEVFPYMGEVEVLLGSGGVCRVVFSDGTEQFMSDDEKPEYLYSPRLAPEKLERFCRENIAIYRAFHDRHIRQIIRCECVQMEAFWE
jgi:hypothetical protein